MTKLLIKLFIKNSDAVTDPDVRKSYGFLSGVVGIICNILLFAGKVIAGLFSSSISIIADAVNNLSDAGSSVVTLVGFKMAGMPPDKEHPFGHGRMEYLAGMIIAIIIMLMGFELGKGSVEKIFSGDKTNTDTIILSSVVLGASILVKLWMCVFNRKLGKSVKSAPILATSFDSLSDVCATSAVLISGIVTYFTGFELDGYVGIVVAVFVFYAGFKSAKDSMTPILGERPDKELVDEIEKTVVSYKGIVGVHDMIVHNYGVGISIITLHAEVPCTMDFVQAHELIDVIEDDLKIKYKCLATIHMDPVATDDEYVNELKQKVKRIVHAIDPVMTIHDFRMTKGVYHENLIFDVVVPFGFRLSDEQVIENIRMGISAIDDKYFAVIDVDKQMC